MAGGGGDEYVKLLFWAQMAQKSLHFHDPVPSNAPLNGYCPPQNHYVLRHVKQHVHL
jgi:hypothetical protein